MKMEDLLANGILVVEDHGDQESRLTSIDNVRIVMPKDGITFEEILEKASPSDEDEGEHFISFAKSIVYADRVITISNEFYDEDNVKREDLIDGKDLNDPIRGFQFNKSEVLDKLGFTIVFNKNTNVEDMNSIYRVEKAWVINKTYKDTLELLRSIEINPVQKLTSMWWDSSKLPKDDGNMQIFEDYLNNSPEFFQITKIIALDGLNCEYIHLIDEEEETEDNE